MDKLDFISMIKYIPGSVLLIALCAILSLSNCTITPESQEIHQAGLIVQHEDGSTIVKCINFQGDEITGEELLQLSGIPYSSDVTNPMGSKVCSIDGQGCSFPAEDCFCQCGNTGSCTYWSYFVLNQDGEWVYAPVGAKGRTVHNGDVDAWAWLTRASKDDPFINPTLPEIDFETICGIYPSTP
jgi:hypothetical protein